MWHIVRKNGYLKSRYPLSSCLFSTTTPMLHVYHAVTSTTVTVDRPILSAFPFESMSVPPSAPAPPPGSGSRPTARAPSGRPLPPEAEEEPPPPRPGRRPAAAVVGGPGGLLSPAPGPPPPGEESPNWDSLAPPLCAGGA